MRGLSDSLSDLQSREPARGPKSMLSHSTASSDSSLSPRTPAHPSSSHQPTSKETARKGSVAAGTQLDMQTMQQMQRQLGKGSRACIIM
eukprot:m.369964 g.369964  ORF g.369964 m.369964 type:complete len:89 (+) comp56120_c0_seq1:543-809(+)